MKGILLVFVLAAAASAQAQDPYKTHEFANCRYFEILTKYERVTYAIGFYDAVALSRPKGELRDYWIESNPKEIADGIHRICSAPENARVTVFNALVIFAMKVKGAGAAEVERLLGEARRLVTEPEKGPK